PKHRHAATAELSKAVPPCPPLPPQVHAQPPSDPRIEIRQHARRLAEAKVAPPADQVTSQRLDQLGQAHAACPTRQFPDSCLETLERLRRDLPLAAIVCDTKAQELPFLGSSHGAFRLVDRKPELGRQEVTHAGQHAFAGPGTANVDVAVVRIAAEAV